MERLKVTQNFFFSKTSQKFKSFQSLRPIFNLKIISKRVGQGFQRTYQDAQRSGDAKKTLFGT
jgi:hypothetical protein